MIAIVFEGQGQVMGTVMTDLPVPTIHTVALALPGCWELGVPFNKYSLKSHHINPLMMETEKLSETLSTNSYLDH